MIQHPAVIALLAASLVTSGFLGYAAFHGSRILRHWDLKSGSELQLSLERRTYLISALLSLVLAFQFLSLFLFIFTADALHSRLTGAMCAAGTLNATPFGYPALLLKIAVALLAGCWLILNHADTRGYDYPLIRRIYGLLNLLAPLALLEAVCTLLHFRGLTPAVITSCCGSLFSQGGGGLASEVASLPAVPMRAVFFTVLAADLLCGAVFIRSGRLGRMFSLLSCGSFFVSAAALVSFICLYIYELPTHHCPFCILQKEYGYIGYLLYSLLLAGGVSGAGVGILMPFREEESLKKLLPYFQRRLAAVALACQVAFALLVIWKMLATEFRLG